MKLKSLFYIVLIGSTSLLSCQKDDVEGPELQDIFGEFEVLQPLTLSSNTVNFENSESVEFFAQLSIRTDWKITVTGLESGAKKVISGREREVSNGVAVWDGTITFAPLFSEEQCTTMMTFKQYPDTLFGDTITVQATKPESAIDILISDVEDSGQGFNAFTEPASFNQAVSGSYFQNLFTNPPGFMEVVPAEQQGFWAMTANNSGSIFICGMSLASQSSQQDPEGLYYDFGTLNPDHVYINALVFGFGDGNSRMSIGMQEDDNQDGVYDRFTEGTYNTEFVVDWTGWKVVSIPLSSFNLSTVGGFGNTDATGQKDLDRIINIEFLLLAVEGSSGLTGYCMDYLNFTRFEPWQP
jgi:hypothetical protein